MRKGTFDLVRVRPNPGSLVAEISQSDPPVSGQNGHDENILMKTALNSWFQWSQTQGRQCQQETPSVPGSEAQQDSHQPECLNESTTFWCNLQIGDLSYFPTMPPCTLLPNIKEIHERMSWTLAPRFKGSPNDITCSQARVASIQLSLASSPRKVKQPFMWILLWNWVTWKWFVWKFWFFRKVIKQALLWALSWK